MSRLLGILFVAVGLFAVSAYASAGQAVAIKLDGRAVQLKQAPYVENGSVFVPLRGLFEQLGIRVKWDASTRSVTAISGDRRIVLTIGSKTAYVNGKAETLTTAPFIRNNATYIPLRFTAAVSGFDVRWDGKTRTVNIGSPINALTTTTIGPKAEMPNTPTGGANGEKSQTASPADSLAGVGGRVSDAAGQPVKGATVYFNQVDDIFTDYTAVTSQNGTYASTELEAGITYSAVAFPPFAYEAGPSEHYAFQYNGGPLQLPDLIVRDFQVRVKLIDEAGVAVGGWADYSLSLLEVGSGRGDSSMPGTFVSRDKGYGFTGLTAGKEYAFSVFRVTEKGLKYTVLDIVSGNDRFVYHGGLLALELHVKPPAPSTDPYVRLITPDGGNAIEGNVSLHAADTTGKFYSTRSEGNNEYYIVGLQPGTTVKVSVGVRDESPYKASAQMTFTYQAGQRLLGEIALAAQEPARMTGRFVNEGGNGIKGFSIDLVNVDTQETTSRSWNSADGRFSLYDLQPGNRYRISVSFFAFEAVTYNNYVRLPPYTFVYDSSMTELPTFVVPKVQVIGKVVQPNGEPLSAYAKLFDAAGNLLSDLPGSTDHQYGVGGMVEGRTYTVNLLVNYPATKETVRNLGLPKLHSFTFVYTSAMKRFDTIVIDMEAKEPGVGKKISGRVVDRDGRPVAGVEVRFVWRTVDSLNVITVKTDAAGFYKIHFYDPTQGEIYAIGTDGFSARATFSVADRDVAMPDLLYERSGG